MCSICSLRFFIAAAFAATTLLLSSDLAEAQEFEDVHKCDDYAAHPNDPNRWAAGVMDEDIIPGPAVKFCRQAVEEHPETPRFAFQLGRALWAANRIDDGTEVFLTLEKEFEYGPVYGYLADAYMYGLGGIEADEELAIALYQIAAEDGFSPAANVLAALASSDGTDNVSIAESDGGDAAPSIEQPLERVMAEQPQAAPQESPFNPSQYNQPKIVNALYSGNFSSMKVQGVGKTNYAGLSNTYLYIATFHKQFGGTVNFKDQTCVALYDPSVTKKLESRVLKIMGGGGRGLENSLNQGAEQGFKMMADLLSDLHRGGVGSLMETQHNLSALADSGGIDGARLISLHGCQSEVTKRIYANIRAYAFGQAGIPSPEEAARRERQKAQEQEQAAKARQLALRTDAKASCVAQWKKDALCGCMIDALDQQDISESEWKSVSGDFKAVISLARGYDGLSDKLRACRT